MEPAWEQGTRRRTSVRDETRGVRTVLGAFFLLAAAACAWKAWDGLSTIGVDAGWKALLIVAGVPTAIAAGLVALGIAVAQGAPEYAAAKPSPSEERTTSTPRMTLKLIGFLVVTFAPLFQNAPPGLPWASFFLKAVVPLLAAAAIGTSVGLLLLLINRPRVRVRPSAPTTGDRPHV